MVQLTGRVITPGDGGWEEARRGFARWPDYEAHTPRVVVFCQDTADVVNAVQWAQENRVPLRPRCGRHNYEGWSSLVKDGIIVDVSDIDSVRVSRDSGTAQIGAGIDMLDLSEAVGQVGVTFPSATGKTVGLSGLTLGGGFGVTTRKWGLTCDNLLAVEMVTADGGIVQASADTNPDLFWACRGGGGGNFGIVTAFTFTVHKVGNVAVFSITYPWDAFEAVVSAWQEWAPVVDDSVTSFLTLLSTRTLTMQGQFTPDSDADLPRINELLAPMLALGPQSVNIQMLPYLNAARLFLGVDPLQPEWRIQKHSDDQIFKSSSALVYQPFPPEAIALLKSRLEAYPGLSASPSQPSMIQLLGGGGAMSRVATDATAVWHRRTKFVVQYDAYWTAPEDGKKTLAWITDFRREMTPYTVGAYVNYADDKLTDPLRQYYGDNLARLVEIKRHWDPGNFFQFPQSLPLSLPHPTAPVPAPAG